MSYEADLAAVLPPYPPKAAPTENNEAARLVIGLARLDILERNDGDPDLDVLPDDSGIRMLHSWRSVKLGYGQIGLAEGALNPRHAIGTIEHTADKTALFRRLVWTNKFLDTIYFGSYRQAKRVTDQIFKMHVPVKGEFAEDVGQYPAGTIYDAHDPAMMLWTLSSIDQPPRDIFEATVRELSPVEHEATWQERLLVGRLIGLSPDDAPKTYAEAKAYRQEQLKSRKELHEEQPGISMGREICLGVPVHPLLLPARELLVKPAVRRMLSPEARKMLGIRNNLFDRIASLAAVKAIAFANHHLPESLTQGSVDWIFDSVKAEEDRRRVQGTNYQLPDPYTSAA